MITNTMILLETCRHVGSNVSRYVSSSVTSLYRYILTKTMSNLPTVISIGHSSNNLSISFTCDESSTFTIGTVDSEGIDLPVIGDTTDTSLDNITISPRSFCKLRHGLRIQESNNCYAEIWPRSSASKYGLLVISGVVDKDYRGEIMTVVYNTTDKPIILRKVNDKFPTLSQLLVKRCFTKNNISIVHKDEYGVSHDRIICNGQVRGVGGFGSTGR